VRDGSVEFGKASKYYNSDFLNRFRYMLASISIFYTNETGRNKKASQYSVGKNLDFLILN
jgi:hypothetical protein